jgi:hypothetical protein
MSIIFKKTRDALFLLKKSTASHTRWHTTFNYMAAIDNNAAEATAAYPVVTKREDALSWDGARIINFTLSGSENE